MRTLLVFLALSSGAGLGLYACSSTTTAQPGDGGTGTDAPGGDVAADTQNDGGAEASAEASTDAAGDAPDADAQLPSGDNFAFHHMYLGDTDVDGGSSPSAWKDFGANIDGKITAANSSDVCTLAQGSPKSTQIDGTNGIDNSWGANLLPIFLTIAANFSQTYNQQIVAGTFTTMLEVEGLTSMLNQTSANTPASLFVGSPFPGTPTFTTADIWPVAPQYLKDGQTLASGSKFMFPSGAITQGTWSSGAPGDVPFDIPFAAATMHVVIHHATVAFTRTTATEVTQGVVSGVLDTNEFIAELQRVAGEISTSFCGPGAFDSIRQQVLQAQDILLDGTNLAGQPCTGISIGLGFVADSIAPVQSVGPQPVAPPDPCDAGAG